METVARGGNLAQKRLERRRHLGACVDRYSGPRAMLREEEHEVLVRAVLLAKSGRVERRDHPRPSLVSGLVEPQDDLAKRMEIHAAAR